MALAAPAGAGRSQTAPAGAGRPRPAPILAGRRAGPDDCPGVGALLFVLERPGRAAVAGVLCTAVLIQPDVAVLAGHCDLGGRGAGGRTRYFFTQARDLAAFGRGASAPLPAATVAATGLAVAPGFVRSSVTPGLGRTDDLALLFLAAAAPGVTMAPLLPAGRAAALVPGAAVQICGYGRYAADSRGSGGVLRVGEARLGAVGAFEMQVGGDGGPGKCHGDSGGPSYLAAGPLPPPGASGVPAAAGPDAAAARELALVGITSHTYDGHGCLRGAVDTRLDPYRAWIDATLAAACADGRRPACTTRGAAVYAPAQPR